MDLVDDVKDLVIVQMALDTEWHRRFRPALSLAQQARVLGPDFQLDLPSPLEAEQLEVVDDDAAIGVRAGLEHDL